MTKIVFIGNSEVVSQTIEKIRLEDKASEITVFALDGFYPFTQTLVAELVTRDIKEDKIFCQPSSFYRANNVNVILERKISRINFKRKRISTEEKDQIDFDYLVLTHPNCNRLSDLKGASKSGVFVLNQLSQIKKMIGQLPLCDTITLQGNNFNLIRLAAALKKREKEVQLICPSQEILDGILDAQSAAFIRQALEQKGIRIYCNAVIAEILGDSDAKAVRLTNKKVLGSQIVLLNWIKPDLRFLNDTELDIKDEGIMVNERFQTNIEGVFAADELAISPDDTSLLEAQSCFIAEGVLQKQSNPASHAFPIRNIPVFDLPVSLIGCIQPAQHGQEFVKISPDQSFQKIFAEDGKIKGCVLINAGTETEKFLQWAAEGADVSILTPEGFVPNQEGVLLAFSKPKAM